MGKRHNLIPLNIFTLDGKINDLAPAEYQGLDRFEARKKVVSDLERQALLVGIKPHKLMVQGATVSCGDRAYANRLWYVSMEGLAKSALEAVAGEDQIYP